MSEERKPVYIVTFRQGRRRLTKIEIFRRSQWTGNPADDLEYRCRVNRVWHGGRHGSMTFLDAAGVLTLIKKAVAAGGVV